MAYTSRSASIFPPGTSTGTAFRQPSGHPVLSQHQSSVLAARVASKKAELESLKQLQDLSSTLATQMRTLEDRLNTLKDGTEGSSSDSVAFRNAPDYLANSLCLTTAVACVLSNWGSVLHAINMASSMFC